MTYRPGDLVRLGTGDGAFYAEIRRTYSSSTKGPTTSAPLRRGRLEVRMLHGAHTTREVLTRDVAAHWRRVR